MDLDLQGKTALVTGASKGIGLACAELLAEEGCHLHLTARTAADLDRAKETIRKKANVQITVHPMDLSKRGAPAELAAACGNLDILVNNAGAIPAGDIEAIDEDRWRDAWDLKIFGYINLTRIVYADMKAKGGGVIVNVIGAAGHGPRSNYIAGSAGNAALIALTKGLGCKSPEDGIRVVGLSPGQTLTERMETMLRVLAREKFDDEERWQELVNTSPPPGKAEEIADLAVYLASRRASHITGTTILIDGGASGR